MSRIYSVHVKEEPKPRHTHVGMATVHLDDIITFLWGKDTALYWLVIEDVEYDLECRGCIEEKIHAIVDLHDAFFAE